MADEVTPAQRTAHQPATVPAADHGARVRRAVLAGHGGDRAGARVLARDPDAAVRGAALGALARLGALSANDVVGALGDGDAGVRRRACTIAGRMLAAGAPRGGADGASGTLVGVLVEVLAGDPDWQVVEAAAAALGEMSGPGDGRVVHALAAVGATHDEPLCREAAVAALGALAGGGGVEDPEAALAAVLGALEDRPAVRRRAAAALAAFDDPRAEAGLRRCLDDRDWQVRQAAEELLDAGG